MIQVTRLNGKDFTLNALLIETIESTPDTVITLVTGNKYVVKQDINQVNTLVKAFLRQIDAIKISAMSQDWGDEP